MLLGRVIGTVVTNMAYEGLRGVPMLIVQPLDPQKHDTGEPVVCADATRMAGPGELIYFEGGREAAMALDPWFVPVDHAIIGIVDGVNQDGAPAGFVGKGEPKPPAAVGHSRNGADAPRSDQSQPSKKTTASGPRRKKTKK